MISSIKFLIRQQLVRGSMHIMFVNAIGMSLAYLTHMVLAKWLGVAQYGDYVYALAWLNVLAVVGQLGMNTSVERLTAELRGQKKHAAIMGLSIFSTLVVACSAGAVLVAGGIVLLVMSDPMSDPLTDPMAEQKFLTLAIMLPLVIVVCFLYQRMSFLKGFERVAQAQVFLEIVRPTVLIVLVGAGLYFFQVKAYMVMAANLIATAIALCLAFFVVRYF
ncbi:MAG: oligosaccharide flippase family protein, partial [Magnetovibrio sp.]|nr:oligosaccharide flippase family protein [Magnetovibrio sp.]